MKAIMIFDFEDDWIKRNNIKLDDLFGHVVIYEKDSLNEQCDYTNRRYWCFNSLKPMPQKKYAIQGMKGYSSTVKECKGYNKCIDEILGEEE